jgi:hypothetical protein
VDLTLTVFDPTVLFAGAGRTCSCRPRLDGMELDCGCRPEQGLPVDQGLMGWSLTVAVGRAKAYL